MPSQQQAILPSQYIHEYVVDLKVGEVVEVEPNALFIDKQGKCWLYPRSCMYRDIVAIDQLENFLRVVRDENGYHVSIPERICYKWSQPYTTDDERIEFQLVMGEPQDIPIATLTIISASTVHVRKRK